MNREFHLNEEVFLDIESVSSRCRTRIVGLKPNCYVIVDLIVDHPISSRLKVEDPIWVYCQQPPVCRFRTRVQQVVADPPLLVLDYPPGQAIEGIEQRRHERKKVFIGVNCSWEPKRRFFLEGYILDVSKSGCQILGDLTQCIDRNVFLSFRIPWTGGEIQAEARVVRCEPAEKGIRSGLEFIHLDPENQERLDALIGSLTEGKVIGPIIGDGSHDHSDQ